MVGWSAFPWKTRIQPSPEKTMSVLSLTGTRSRDEQVLENQRDPFGPGGTRRLPTCLS